MAILGGLKDIIESAGSIWLQGESIHASTSNAGTSGGANQPSDFPRVETGANSDGSTLIKGTLVSGISNGKLLLGSGVALLIVAGLIAWAAND